MQQYLDEKNIPIQAGTAAPPRGRPVGLKDLRDLEGAGAGGILLSLWPQGTLEATASNKPQNPN